MTTATPEILKSLLRAVWDDDLQAVCEAAKALALRGDRTIVPRLIQEREAVRAELNAGDRMVDASEGRREEALTMVIISLLNPAECETLQESGNEFEKYMVNRKRNVTSAEEFWGPLRG